jgi:hypothetical protein
MLIRIRWGIWILLLIEVMRNLRSLAYRGQTLDGSIISLHASIVSVHGPPWLQFEAQQLLNFDFDADPAFHTDADPMELTRRH